MKALKHDFEITKEMKLPEPFKANWLRDLRSGKYGQCTGTLTDFSNNYCCLGVACKSVGYNDRWLTRNGGGSCGYIYKQSTYLKYELKKVPNVLKRDSKNPVVAFLTDANDNYYTFKQIANWIEKYL